MSNQSFRTVPTFSQAITPGYKNDSVWYRYFQANENGEPPANESAIAVGGSPFTFVAPTKGMVIIAGGTVSLVQFNRSGTQVNFGQTTGNYILAQNDAIRVTYSGKPVMTFVPL
jgi:hypothetical protein